MLDKKRQIVLISGASKGIGNTCATFLAKRGHQVYGTSRTPGSRPRMMDEFFQLLQMDNQDAASINGVVADILQKEGRIDLVVCNAGISLLSAEESLNAEAGLRQLDINFMGAARLIEAVLPSMRRNNSGTILVIGSIGGRIGLPFNAYYSASKFALEGYVESLRLELAHSGIRIALIEPGSIRTGNSSESYQISGTSAGEFDSECARVRRVLLEEYKAGINPIVLARLINRLMDRKKLRPRYRVGRTHQQLAILLKTVFPSRLYELILLHYFKLANKYQE